MSKKYSICHLRALAAVLFLLAAGCSFLPTGEGSLIQGSGAVSSLLPLAQPEAITLYAYGESHVLAPEDFAALLSHLERRIPETTGEGEPFSGEEIEALKRGGRLLELCGGGSTLLFPLGGGMDDRFSADGVVYTGLSPEAATFLPVPDRVVLHLGGESTVLIGEALAEAMAVIQMKIPDTISSAALAFDRSELLKITEEVPCLELLFDQPTEFCYLSTYTITCKQVSSLLFPLEGRYAKMFWDGENWLGGLRDLPPAFEHPGDSSMT